MQRTHKTERGAALIMTLVAIAIVGVLMAAVGNLVLGHYARARTDQDAAKALNYAEAALNYQIQKISANINSSTLSSSYVTSTSADNGNTTYLLVANTPGSSPTGPMNAYLPLSTTGDICKAWVEGTLDLYGSTFIYGRATVNGVMRTVRAKGGSVPASGLYALYAINDLQLQGNPTINGSLGAGDDIDLIGSPAVTGSIYADNSGTVSGAGSIPVVITNDPPPFPSITDIANRNDTYLRGDTGTPLLTGSARPTYWNNLPSGVGNGANAFAGIDDFKTASPGNTNDIRNDNQLALLNGVANNKFIDGTTLGGKTLKLAGKPYGANYYITGLSGSNVDIQADISAGPVNLWVVGSSGSGDALSGSTYIGVLKDGSGNPDATQKANVTKFNVYYSASSSSARLRFTGGGNPSDPRINIIAMIYAYDVNSGGAGRGGVDFNGNVDVYGSVLAYDMARGNLSVGGSTTITFPSNVGASPGSGLLFYGVKTPWQEYNPVRGVTP